MTDGQYQQYPEDSRATLSIVLGILGLVLCGIVAPFAWAIGNSEVKAIDAGRRNPANRGTAQAGKVLGIIGTVFLALGVIALVAVMVFSVVTISAGSTSSSSGSEYGEPQVQGQLSPMPPNAAVDTSATGELSPIVVGADFDGNEVRIENDGRAKAIVLLAHWCPHCQNEVPEVQAWLNSGGGVEGVDMYSVTSATASPRDNYPPSDWLDREGWTVPVIVDDADNSVYGAYGRGGFPFWVFVNSDGTVAARAAGRLGIDQLEPFMRGLN